MDKLIYDIAWWFMVLLTVIPAIYICFTKDVMRAAFALLATFLGVAGLYVFLQAYFVAVTQIMVYVGGILVLILFGIMLSVQKGSTYKIITGVKNRLVGGLVAIITLGGLIYLFQNAEWEINTGIRSIESTEGLGFSILTEFILPFEIVGVILLIALIAATYISKESKHE